MPKYSRLKVLTSMIETGMVPVFYHPEIQVSIAVIDACAAGGAIGGPNFVKDVLGPLPWSRLKPTGRVDTTEESISSWMKAGVACVGIGSKLFPKETIETGNYPEISEKVK